MGNAGFLPVYLVEVIIQCDLVCIIGILYQQEIPTFTFCCI